MILRFILRFQQTDYYDYYDVITTNSQYTYNEIN